MDGLTSTTPFGVEVVVTGRLHLGFLDLHGGLGRRFGSIGLSIREPRGRLTLRQSTVNEVVGAERERAGRYLATMQSRDGLAGEISTDR